MSQGPTEPLPESTLDASESSPLPHAFDPWSDDTPDGLTDALAEVGPATVVVCAVQGEPDDDGDWATSVTRRVAEETAVTAGNTMLIDLDLERPRLHRILGDTDGEGISDVFLFSASLDHVSRPLRGDSLSLVSAGTVVADAGALLRHEWWDGLLRHLGEQGTNVVLHVPFSADGAEAVLTRAHLVVLMTRNGAVPDPVRALDAPVIRLSTPTDAQAEVEGEATGQLAAERTEEAPVEALAQLPPEPEDVSAEQSAAPDADELEAPPDELIPETDAQEIDGDFAEESAEVIDQVFSESAADVTEDDFWAEVEETDDPSSSREDTATESWGSREFVADTQWGDEDGTVAESDRPGHSDDGPEDGDFAEELASTRNPFAPLQPFASSEEQHTPAEDHDGDLRTAHAEDSVLAAEFEGLPDLESEPTPRRRRTAAVLAATVVVLAAATVALAVAGDPTGLLPIGLDRAPRSASTVPTPQQVDPVEQPDGQLADPASTATGTVSPEAADVADPQMVDPLSRIRDDFGPAQQDPATGTPGSPDAPAVLDGAAPLATETYPDSADATPVASGEATDEETAEAVPEPLPALPEEPDPLDVPLLPGFAPPTAQTGPTGKPTPDVVTGTPSSTESSDVRPADEPAAVRPATADDAMDSTEAVAQSPADESLVQPLEEDPVVQPVVPAAGGGSVGLPPFPDRPAGLMAFGVVVRGYWGLEAAMERRAALEAQLTHLQFIVSPVDTDGALLYRVVAGPASSVDEARGILQSLQPLLGSGADEAVVTATRWAYLLGVFEDHAEASARAIGVRDEGIPAYLAEVPTGDGKSIYRVYAGAFATEREAATFGGLIDGAGLGPARLTERTGRPVR